MQPIQRRPARLLLCLGVLSLVAPACRRERSEGGSQPPATQAPAAATAPAQAPGPSPTPPPADDRIAGTVVETMSSGGYTYAKIDRGGKPVWTAGPATTLAVGDRVAATNGTLMTGFHSATLDRTFDEIYFVSSFGGGAAPPPAAAAPTVEKIEPVAGGTAIADLYAKKAQLAGKPVVVRGKVMKVNDGIMGRNWVHLQDGSGAAGTNDLLVTTNDSAKVGDVVVARGALAIDKDFGSGYSYAVVLESASLAAK